ncbi:FadR/GntR family transcriptional regulator [Dyadobacter fermentans]|uniref:GntR domain protein n=1 Tax=Dyadobacter fermentans (strain ATCC 700827 / DSM 18053 / CIP 107007 / KCTC 52180 / NS114) TaxID=471854 RepID=C6W5M3_DYAFD|nr:FadR/GntR family transcriptional regulator [Dyadobacter fermentans]ACT94241.1 GntR domain protein [Dyadobacter fermentans DSM 18053]
MGDIFPNIKSVDTSSLVDKVESNLIQFFIDHNFKVGDSIPKELELAQSLGVSRTVVREAMLRLRLMGLVESKKHRGAVITSPDLVSILEKSMNPKILDGNTLKEIFEMRLSLEIGMADFIMERVTPDDIAVLKTLVENEPISSDRMIFQIEHEIAFHGKLYEITRNETMKKFQRMLLPVFDYVHKSGLLRNLPPNTNFISHKDIVEIIENGSAEKLRNGMRSHLENHFARLLI